MPYLQRISNHIKYLSRTVNIMTSLLIFLCACVYSVSSFMYYWETLVCEATSPKGCTKWRADAHMKHYLQYGFSYCFPASTYVQTNNGPLAMRQLQLGDEILSIDPETGEQQYSQVVAWLHRDPQSLALFRTIQTDKHLNFTASKLHNIAYQAPDGKINYSFARDLKTGDRLITRDHSSLKVVSSSVQTEETGLFAPMTENGNYFVYSSDFDSSQQSGEASKMILVHSYSQVHHPDSYVSTGLFVINVAKSLSSQEQLSDDQSYIHPLVGSCRWVFGSDWVQATQRIKVPSHYYTSSTHSTQKANHYYAVSGAYGQHYQQVSHMLGISHDYYSSTSSTTYSNNRQNERRKQIGMNMNLLFLSDITLY